MALPLLGGVLPLALPFGKKNKTNRQKQQHKNIRLICLAQLRDHYNLRRKLLREEDVREELVLLRIEFIAR